MTGPYDPYATPTDAAGAEGDGLAKQATVEDGDDGALALHAPLYRAGDGWVAGGIAFCLRNRLIVAVLVALLLFGGYLTAPFAIDTDWVATLPAPDSLRPTLEALAEGERWPVAVDAIPDLGENQQIVFTEWPGRSPRDIEDQITYPLTARLLNVRGVKTVRSLSMFGFSTIYVVFEEGVEFYWSRDRVQERLNAITPGELPEGVRPRLGPDATPLGQIYWYTLEGRDPEGRPVGGWDLHELRSIQDWQVKFELLATPGVAEVASVGGFVQEYQVEADPAALHAHQVSLPELIAALKASNIEIGARTLEINRAEYVIRSLGFVKSKRDLAEAVVTVREGVPIRVRDVARVSLGPALRRGLLDKDGVEAVGGVVVAQYGANPMEVLTALRARVERIAPSLPAKMVTVNGPDGPRRVRSQVAIVPFYDRSKLIRETLGTLGTALWQQILLTVLVVVAMLMNLRGSVIISLTLPLAVLLCFLVMKVAGVTANVVALGGIAIAIGTIVDMGIVLTENVVEHLRDAPPGRSTLRSVYNASAEVGGAILTAVATTVIGFVPVFFLTGDQGKLYRPLAFTKTFALLASLLVALVVIPPLAHWLLSGHVRRARPSGGAERETRGVSGRLLNGAVIVVVLVLLTRDWMPLGIGSGLGANLLFVATLVGGLLGFFWLFHRWYESILRLCLRHAALFLLLPALIILGGAGVLATRGYELMPSLDEGAFLFMPSTMPHASIGEAREVMSIQDRAIRGIPEVESVVGKLGRVDSPLDPAPIGMSETIINYRNEYWTDPDGSLPRFRYDPGGLGLARDLEGAPMPAPDGEPYTVRGIYPRGADGRPIPDAGGEPFRNWRRPLDPELNPGRAAWGGIRSPSDIWAEVERVTAFPGVTKAQPLGPIETRFVMLQSGLKGQVGLIVQARGDTSLERLQEAGLALEQALRETPGIRPATVVPDRVTGKPYLVLEPDRAAMARYGLTMNGLQRVIQAAIGGEVVTRTVEGRERYSVLVRYLRELRDSPEALERVLVPIAGGGHVPLKQVLVGRSIRFERGPSVIKSEEGALVMYISFQPEPGVSVVEATQRVEERLGRLRAEGVLDLPAGVTYDFVGAYQRYRKVMAAMMMLVPVVLLLIFLILYMEFRRVWTTLIVFAGVFVAAGGGMLLVGAYGGLPDWMNLSLGETTLFEVFQIRPIFMSTAIIVGFLALFGIATDDGVVMATYLEQTFRTRRPATAAEALEATVAAAKRRVRPCLMTTATTILALLPVLTSTGRGSEVMAPMAIPIFGGMLIEVVTMFVVPVLYWAGYAPDGRAEDAMRVRDGAAPGSSSDSA